MVELGGLLLLTLDARVLDEEQVGRVRAHFQSISSVEIAHTEANASFVFADCRVEQIADPLTVWAALRVEFVVDACVDWAACVRVVNSVVKDLANRTVRAGDGDFAKANRDVAALNSRVAQVADHSSGMAGPFIAVVGDTGAVPVHGWDQEQGKHDEHPDHAVKDVNVRYDAIA